MKVGKHVALLRGINVGRAKRIAMADLRALVEGLGYRDVRTLLNSGNVVFTVPGASKGDPASRIEKALETELGLSSRVTVLTAAELDAIVLGNPLLDVADDASRLLVAVVRDPKGRSRLAELAKHDWAPEVLAVREGVAYVWFPQGILKSRLGETLLRDATTTRNWATILKLHALTR
jgi:uncharacterized protein (DUF1697 family)